MSNGADMLETAIATWPGREVEVRYSGNNVDLTGTIASAFCAGIDEAKIVTDQGLLNGAEGRLRYLTADEPSGWAAGINGQVVEIRKSGGEWKRLRVKMHGGDREGATSLDVMAEFEEM